MRKAQKLYLCIAFILFAVAATLLTIHAVQMIVTERSYASNPDLYKHMNGWSLFLISVLHVPALFLMLSLIKNGYALLAKDKSKSKIFFCILSSILALAPVIMLFIMIANDSDKLVDAVLLSAWPMVVISFILGCIDLRKNENFV